MTFYAQNGEDRWLSSGIGGMKAAIMERMTADGYQLMGELGCNLIFKDRA